MKAVTVVQSSYGSQSPGRSFHHERKPRNRVLMAIAVLCMACGLILAATNNYLLEEGFPAQPAPPQLSSSNVMSLKVTDNGAPVVALTPELIRTILNLPEKEQKALVLPANSAEEMHAQMSVIGSTLQLDPTSALTAQQLNHDEAHHESQHGLEEHEGHHTLTPAQERAERMWALIFVTAIVTASVLFETMKELIESNTPDTMQKVVEKFFGELATLGFIGTIAFVLTTGFAGHESVLGHLSFWYTGDNELLIHEFEILHFLIFFVMIFFVSAVLVILQIAVNQKRVWTAFEKKLEYKDKEGKVLPPREEKKRQLKLMNIQDEQLKVEGTLTSEYTKPHRVREAEFVRFRQRFLDDAECQVTIPADFNFADYLTRCVSHILSEVVEIGVHDWVVLWILFLSLFCLLIGVQTIFPNLRNGHMPVYVVCGAFALLQLLLLISAVMGFRTLSYIKAMLLPAMDKTQVDRASAEASGELHFSDLVRAPKYVSEMSVVVEEGGWLHWVLHKSGYKTRKPSKHEQLFGPFGSSGPSFFLTFIKLVLLASVVSVAVLCVVLFGPLWELSPVLPFIALLPSVVCIFLTPRMVVLYTWCCSTEMLKNSEVVIEVVREQKQKKLIDIMRILTMLSFFLDQVEFLKSVAQTSSADLEAVKENKSISDQQWVQLKEATDPQVLEDLEKLFNQYDDDASGELDEGEVKQLVEQLGTPLNDEEAKSLFRIMDADGSGSVDFKEFAMVVLHQKNAKSGKLNLSAIAVKMFNIFDKHNTGIVREDDILEQMAKIGSNWDRDGVRFFLQQIDKDGSGEIEKYEFVDFISRIEAEVNF